MNSDYGRVYYLSLHKSSSMCEFSGIVTQNFKFSISSIHKLMCFRTIYTRFYVFIFVSILVEVTNQISCDESTNGSAPNHSITEVSVESFFPLLFVSRLPSCIAISRNNPIHGSAVVNCMYLFGCMCVYVLNVYIQQR